MLYTKISGKHMHLSNARSQKNHSYLSHIRCLRENAFNLDSILKSTNSKKKILLRPSPGINFICLFIWPVLIIKQLHWAFLFVRSCFLSSGNGKVIIKWLVRVGLYFMNVTIYTIVGICKLLNRKLYTETTWILQFYQDNASRFQQGWFQLICDKWEDKAISAHHDTPCS